LADAAFELDSQLLSVPLRMSAEPFRPPRFAQADPSIPAAVGYPFGSHYDVARVDATTTKTCPRAVFVSRQRTLSPVADSVLFESEHLVIFSQPAHLRRIDDDHCILVFNQAELLSTSQCNRQGTRDKTLLRIPDLRCNQHAGGKLEYRPVGSDDVARDIDGSANHPTGKHWRTLAARK
jgi:hypothetical protein